jgi:hypothetical protein
MRTILDVATNCPGRRGLGDHVQFVKIPPPRSGPRETANTLGPIGQGVPGKRWKSGAASQSKKSPRGLASPGAEFEVGSSRRDEFTTLASRIVLPGDNTLNFSAG